MCIFAFGKFKSIIPITCLVNNLPMNNVFFLVFSIITLLMFNYLAGVIVWVVLIGVIVVSVALTVLLWWALTLDWDLFYQFLIDILFNRRIHYKVAADEHPDDEIGQRNVKMFLAFAIIATIITVAMILTTIFMRKRIKLVIVLFQEAGKASFSMPLLLFEPILVIIIIPIRVHAASLL